ncbi:hypothetical protein KAR91_03935 [Candidatus Pacearchaeota archaeon]|nr:hypothetical protein [Candidatus Pacearchaeota archaeon]
MPSGKPIKGKVENKIIALKSTGMIGTEVAEATGTSNATVSRLGKKHRDLILEAQTNLLEQAIKPITERMIDEVSIAIHLKDHLKDPNKTKNKTALEDKKDMLTYIAMVNKREEGLLKAVGILPTNAPSIHVQQIFNDNRKTVMSPQVADLLRGRMDEITEADFEDLPD